MSLREELSQIPGIIDADIDLRDGRPTAIRIHPGEGADQRAIGEAVQHALRRHGLRSRVAPPRRGVEPQHAPAPPHLSLMPSQPTFEPTPEPLQAVSRRVVSVGVRDDGTRSVVTVTDDGGETVEERARRSPDSQIAATTRAVGRLFDTTTQPELQSVRRWERDGTQFITVIVDVDGRVRVGSAVDDGLELRAVAQAVWQALSA